MIRKTPLNRFSVYLTPKGMQDLNQIIESMPVPVSKSALFVKAAEIGLVEIRKKMKGIR